MEDKAILCGDFASFKHIKTRKVFVIEIEFPEEQGRKVLETLGMPIGGESKPVAVALLDKSIVTKHQTNCDRAEQTEGEKLRTRAVMLCDDKLFREFCSGNIAREFGTISMDGKQQALSIIYGYCEIESRSELANNKYAQALFKDLLAEFDAWKLSNQYADNLNRS